MSDDERITSIPKAAKLIGMSASWLRAKVDAGEVPCFRPGKHRRVCLADVLPLKTRSIENGLPKLAKAERDYLSE